MSADTSKSPAPSTRDAAFLAEMGITPLWQRRAPAAAPAAQPAQPAPLAAIAAAVDTDTADADISQMDWRALNNAIAACTRCGCKDGRKSVAGDGARAAVWMVVAGATTAQDEAARTPLAGAPGKLLANMLKAVQLAREENVYVTNLVKCRLSSASGGERAPSADELQACRPFVERELALCGAGVVLTLGQVATNALLDQPLQQALAGSRGTLHQFNGAVLVATLHPAELLDRAADKALAWADLCLARASQGQSQ
ncbi:uracil-DNA glycosylase [Massilia sp. PWRC2]|uniref:uracil-DNA glycosylase n=1 Tax=Massilia sp. PWRC2 TaxID=2804626 RepID=UPI003CEE64B6